MNEDSLTIETRIALWSALADLWLDTKLQLCIYCSGNY